MRRKNYYLKLVLRGEIIEDRPSFSFFAQRTQTSLRWLLLVLEKARKHRRIKALILVLKHPFLGWAQIEEIQDELEQFHQAGKPVVVYLENADNQTYYLACAGDVVYLPPPTNLDLVGLRLEALFLKNLLERWGVEPQLFNRGQYKAAAEVFTRYRMSEASRRAADAILNDLQQRLLVRVARRRSATPEQAQAWVDGGPYTARQAFETGLIDGICYEDELESRLPEDGRPWAEFPLAKLRIGEGLIKRLVTFRRPRIAYIVVEGTLIAGESRSGRQRRPLLGSDTLSGALQEVRKKKRVKAVVLRVNSPGGSALASDLIWREVRLTNQEKPVVVSFANVAASGGYYLATAARRIVGMPSTLTGSIGVIAGKFVLSGLLSRFGVTIDTLDKGRRAGYMSPLRSYSEEEEQIVQQQMDEIYQHLFLAKVAENRQKPVETIRELAEGRVWTGAQAAENGLLDRIGGISVALEIARKEAGLPDDRKVRVEYYFRRRSLRDIFSIPRLELWHPGELLASFLDCWRIR